MCFHFSAYVLQTTSHLVMCQTLLQSPRKQFPQERSPSFPVAVEFRWGFVPHCWIQDITETLLLSLWSQRVTNTCNKRCPGPEAFSVRWIREWNHKGEDVWLAGMAQSTPHLHSSAHSALPCARWADSAPASWASFSLLPLQLQLTALCPAPTSACPVHVCVFGFPFVWTLKWSRETECLYCRANSLLQLITRKGWKSQNQQAKMQRTKKESAPDCGANSFNCAAQLFLCTKSINLHKRNWTVAVDCKCCKVLNWSCPRGWQKCLKKSTLWHICSDQNFTLPFTLTGESKVFCNLPLLILMTPQATGACEMAKK